MANKDKKEKKTKIKKKKKQKQSVKQSVKQVVNVNINETKKPRKKRTSTKKTDINTSQTGRMSNEQGMRYVRTNIPQIVQMPVPSNNDLSTAILSIFARNNNQPTFELKDSLYKKKYDDLKQKIDDGAGLWDYISNELAVARTTTKDTGASPIKESRELSTNTDDTVATSASPIKEVTRFNDVEKKFDITFGEATILRNKFNQIYGRFPNTRDKQKGIYENFILEEKKAGAKTT